MYVAEELRDIFLSREQGLLVVRVSITNLVMGIYGMGEQECNKVRV